MPRAVTRAMVAGALGLVLVVLGLFLPGASELVWLGELPCMLAVFLAVFAMMRATQIHGRWWRA